MPIQIDSSLMREIVCDDPSISRGNAFGILIPFAFKRSHFRGYLLIDEQTRVSSI